MIRAITIYALLLCSVFFSCKREQDDVKKPQQIENEAELITTVELFFSDSAQVLPITKAIFRDTDGVGGLEPTQFDTIRLFANQTYDVDLLFWNESKSPVENITLEILEEGDEHIICYETEGVPISIQRTDTDGTFEIGLSSKWKTSEKGNGFVTILLKHQPSIKNGNCDLGETDVELKFVIEVE
jgi:hypothetical protein